MDFGLLSSIPLLSHMGNVDHFQIVVELPYQPQQRFASTLNQGRRTFRYLPQRAP